ncbi:MAG: tRNA epoxyqueuosine(34) reductase QueG [Verrucomicrobiae bacterium]|nr:tRNA epoxyqueuosine(34) reductase QueG [Verrucomicrobiae bacterium]
MRNRLVRRALELGFDACGVSRATPPESAERYRSWLADGCHGTMGYLERTAEKREDPGRVLEGVRSVVVLAASYHASGWLGEEPGKVGRGVVARYARHDDYHEVLASRLKVLAEEVNRWGGEGTRSLWYVDTGPILERDVAQRAGVGFIGKHTNLIGRRMGNWIFLAEILTTAVIEEDAPERNQCGNCERCLTACPTGAITEPFRLDARRCISYLTIELKGSIPEGLRPAVGNRIFGCDDCLAACPWNRFAVEGRLMAGHRRADFHQPELVEWLALDDAAFRARFAGTPMLRVKRRGLLRNVCVALGNTGSPAEIPALERAASDPEPLVAEHARWAIDQIRRRMEARV